MFYQTILKLDNIIRNLLYQASPATSSMDLVPSYFLATISNVIEALMFNRTRRPFDKMNVPFEEMKELTETVINMIDLYLVEVYLQTQIAGERAVFVNAGYFSTKGLRLVAKNMVTDMTMDGTEAKAMLPEGLLDSIGEHDTEVFQTMTTMMTNPYDWGFEDSGFSVSSQVLTVSFRYAGNKSEVEISDLSEDKLVQLWIPKIEHNGANESNVATSDPVHVFLVANQSVQSPLNITGLLTQGLAVHIEIKAIVANDRNYSVMAYLGYGYRPFWYKFDDVLNITTDIQDPYDHTNYTFFIYNQ